MRIRTVHPGVTVPEVQEATGFELLVADDVTATEAPTAEQVRLIREEIDPDGARKAEFR
jgi:hypothetical protein